MRPDLDQRLPRLRQQRRRLLAAAERLQHRGEVGLRARLVPSAECMSGAEAGDEETQNVRDPPPYLASSRR